MGRILYDVVVVGAGHAGCEAALACARMGVSTLLLTLKKGNVGELSCNPAIGGVAKGHLVREIDALGGEMARVIDQAGIQFRMLNQRKGPAVRAPRAQADRSVYKNVMTKALLDQENLKLEEGMVDALHVEKGVAEGVVLSDGVVIRARAVILTTGTFLKGLIHVGMESFPAGRMGEPGANEASSSLELLGFELARLKTGTPPRLDGNTICYDGLESQPGDEPPQAFSFSTKQLKLDQIPCHLTYTNETTHEIIAEHLDESPLYSGVIKGTGPRYCPSIEDKVFKFAAQPRHQVFLEPEGRNTSVVYPNGISTSMPQAVQERFVRSIRGLEQVVFLKPGYAIEYDYVPPTQLHASLESKPVAGLYLAGQINGTSGYEEAAAQGLMAGINAVKKLRGEEPFILDRSEAYIGVLIDDLINLGTKEPYRMFTSRAEYRLLLRHGSADLRLMAKGFKLGLLPESSYRRCEAKKMQITAAQLWFAETKPAQLPGALDYLESRGIQGDLSGKRLKDLMKRPELHFSDFEAWFPNDLKGDPEVAEELEFQIKYEGYIRREKDQVSRFKRAEGRMIPPNFSYDGIPGLSKEVHEKLGAIQPRSLGQAARISGVTPAAISLLMVALEKNRLEQKAS